MTENRSKLRNIKSFVRRSGRLTNRQKKARSDYWSMYGIDFNPEKLNLDLISNNAEHRVLEIGFGNGDALVTMAKNAADYFYLGIEVHSPGVGSCLNNIHDNSLTNVRVISHDAIEVMTQMFAPASFDSILLFFPDPWHKKRHQKRRIVNQKFRDLSAGLLKPGGILHLATDWQDYAETMAEQLLADARFSNQGNPQGFVDQPAYRPSTKFEQRGLRLGHNVWDLMFRKL